MPTIAGICSKRKPALLTETLLQINSLFVASAVIVAFSLLAYISLQNWNSAVARALSLLLTGVVVVFGGTVLLNVPPEREITIQYILRAQWIGIVCVPVGYVHLSYALRSYSGLPTRRWWWFTIAAYLVSAVFLVLAFVGSDLLLGSTILREPLTMFAPGPLFWLFVLYFALTSLGGLRTVLVVRRAALTPTLRRRLTYLGATYLAPGFAVFPYLIFGGSVELISPTVILALAAVRNVSVTIMLIVMVYSIAFQGTLLPDRLIKQDFIRWGLYGPFVGICTILFLRAVPPIADRLGLPRDILITFGVMMMTVLMPIFVSRAKPYIDALVYTQDHDEIDYLRTLPRNTFTYTDLRVLLENTLLVVCGALKVDTGFVAAPDSDSSYTVKTVVGSRRVVKQFVADYTLTDILKEIQALPDPPRNGAFPPDLVVRREPFFFVGLYGPDDELLGMMGLIYPRDGLSPDSRRLIDALAQQMGLALATVQMQQRLFDALRGLGPEMRSLQELTGRLEQATPAALEQLETEVALLPEFPQLVKEALGQYWGGPKLSDSPLLELRTVRRIINDQGNSPTRALQAVLRQAIENLRPTSQLDPSAQEWVLYNILDMRFLQGKRIRDTAEKLAISESDLYRKQRIAVEEVARQLALMEESEPNGRH